MPARAQNAASAGGEFSDQQPVLRLVGDEASYNLLPYLEIYEDAQFSWDLREVLRRYDAGAKGLFDFKDIINLSFKNSLYWFIFDVENKTETDEWMFDFGRIATGKSGIPHKIYIYNATLNKLVYDSATMAEGEQDSFLTKGPAIRINLREGMRQRIVMYILPSDSMSLSFPLHLRPMKFNPGQSQHEFLSGGYFLLILGGAIIFLMGVCLFRGGWIFGPFVVLMILKAAWFWLQNNFIVLPPMLLNWAPVLYVMLSSLLAIFSTWFFANLTKKEGEGSLLLLIVSAILLLGFLMFAFVFPENTILRTVSLYVPYFITFMSIAFYCMGQGAAGVHGARILGLTWMAWLTGFAVHLLCVFGVVPFNVFLLQGEWYAMGAVVFLLMLSVAGRFEGIKQSAVQAVIRKAQKAQSLARLKQSKETADQARLLRVIEREREIMEELRQREAQRTEEMRLAKIAADEANSAKSAFLAVVSHEIRTPMTGIMGMVRLMQDTNLTTDQREFLHTIQDSGDAMLALLNDILDFSKIEGGGMELEVVDFDLYRLVHGVIRLMSGHATQKSITVKAQIAPDTPQFVKGDPTRLRQVLLNLVGNAIKFTTEGGVTLHLAIDERDPRASSQKGVYPIKFSVEDTGIGISKEGQKNLFTPFAQADSSISRKFGGTGLGLAICKRLIEGMGSAIQLHSIEGQGTQFFFTLLLPLGQSDKAANEGLAGSGGATEKPAAVLSVLVVDDNEINRKVIQGLISREGHKSVVAETAADAIALCQRHQFDLVLMDIELPDMNGVEAASHIRAGLKPGQKCHIAALTGNVMKEDVERYLASGMDSHLAKPISPERLRDLLVSLVAIHMINLPGRSGGAAKQPAQDPAPTPQPNQTPVQAAPPVAMTSPAPAVSLTEPPAAPQASAETAPPAQPQPEGEEAVEMKGAVIDSGMMSADGVLSFELTEEDLDDSSFDIIYNGDADSEDADFGAPEPVTQSAIVQATAAEAAPAAPDAIVTEAAPAAPASIPADIFDEPMLASLKKSLGRDQLRELIQPLFDKNDELVAAIAAAFEARNWQELMARAHELKGMSGNFGLTRLSRLGGEIEKAVREGKTDPADFETAVSAMPEVNRLSKDVLGKWMEG